MFSTLLQCNELKLLTHPTLSLSTITLLCHWKIHTIFVVRYAEALSGAKLFCTAMQMTAFIKGALLVIHCVPYHSFPKPQDSAASKEVCQERHQPLSKVPLSGWAGCAGDDLPSHRILSSSPFFVHSGILCLYSLICFSQPGSWCENHKHIWKKKSH